MLWLGIMLALGGPAVQAQEEEATPLSQAEVEALPVELGTPTYGGNGCPTGSVSSALTPDKQAISILFSQYTMGVKVHVPNRRPSLYRGTSGSTQCRISIPIKV